MSTAIADGAELPINGPDSANVLGGGVNVSANQATSLLKLQIGPVQDFIAQARSTRDLWSGSYLLSWLIAHGIRKLLASPGTCLIFPNPDEQPLLKLLRTDDAALDPDELRTPNLPNLFVAQIPADAGADLPRKVAGRIRSEWMAITNDCFDWLLANSVLGAGDKDRFMRQRDRFLSIAWNVTKMKGGAYTPAYICNGRLLDAVRHTRDFKAWGVGGWEPGIANNKDSLSGKEEAIVGGPGFAKLMESRCAVLKSLFRHDDWLGAITLTKRVWHVAYLPTHGVPTESKDFPMPNTRGLAKHKPNSNEDRESTVESLTGENYFAVLAFDGDNIGKWIGGDYVPADSLQQHHKNFSRCLSKFALSRAMDIVTSPDHDGRLIYAGGDDVLALLPADTALACAQELRNAFREETKNIVGLEKTGDPSRTIAPDASVGIVITHFKSPLQDSIRAAQAAEKRAKKLPGKAAVAITLLKRSGETVEWGARWDDDGVKAAFTLSKALRDDIVSAKFPYRLGELISVYRTQSAPMFAPFPPVNGFDLGEVFARELDTVLARHHGRKWDLGGAQFRDDFSLQIKSWLASLLKEPTPADGEEPPLPDEQNRLRAKRFNSALDQMIALFAFCGFAQRLDREPAVENQPAPSRP